MVRIADSWRDCPHMRDEPDDELARRNGRELAERAREVLQRISRQWREQRDP